MFHQVYWLINTYTFVLHLITNCMVYLIQHYVTNVSQWLVTGRWFSLTTPISSTNKTDCHDITEILLKVVLNTITPLNCMRLKQRVLIRLTYNIYYTYWAKATTCSLVVGNGWIFSVISSKYLYKLESHGISNGLLSVVGWVSASFWSCACSSSSFCFSSFSFCAFDFLMKEKYTVRL